MRHSFLDQYSELDSFLHRLDPRVKVVTFFAFILFINFTKPTEFISFGLYGSLLAGLIFLSGAPIRFIFKRSLVVLPFAAVIGVSIPFFKTGHEGLILFWNIFVKSYLSCLCMIILSTTTRFSDLLKALERLRCPSIITMILSFMYRYLYILEDEFMRMKMAKDSRTMGNNRFRQIKTLSGMLGVLFGRAYERGERIYCAMCSRGFDGQIKTMSNFILRKKDIFFAIGVLIFLGLIKFL